MYLQRIYRVFTEYLQGVYSMCLQCMFTGFSIGFFVCAIVCVLILIIIVVFTEIITGDVEPFIL